MGNPSPLSRFMDWHQSQATKRLLRQLPPAEPTPCAECGAIVRPGEGLWSSARLATLCNEECAADHAAFWAI